MSKCSKVLFQMWMRKNFRASPFKNQYFRLNTKSNRFPEMIKNIFKASKPRHFVTFKGTECWNVEKLEIYYNIGHLLQYSIVITFLNRWIKKLRLDNYEIRNSPVTKSSYEPSYANLCHTFELLTRKFYRNSSFELLTCLHKILNWTSSY